MKGLSMIKIISLTITFICLNVIFVQASQNLFSSIDQMIINCQYEQAILLIQQLQEKSDPKSSDYLQMQIIKSNALKALGRHRQALDVLLAYTPMINNYPPDIQVRFYNTLGSLYRYLSQMKKSSLFLQKALTIARQSRHTLLFCETLNEIGLLYGDHFDKSHYYQSAIDAFEKAIQFSHQLSKNYFHAQLMIHLAKVYVKKNAKNHTKKSIQTINNARNYVSKLSDTFRKGCLLLEIAHLYGMLAKKSKKEDRSSWIYQSHQICLDVENINEKINDSRLASKLYYQMGEIYEGTNQFDEAITLTKKSIFFAQQTNNSYDLYMNYWQLGRLYRKSGKINKAINYYNKAIQVLAPMREQIYHSDLTKQNLFNQKIKPVYLELSEIYFNLAAANTESDEKYKKFIQNAWLTMDEVKSAELEDIFNDPCVTYQKENNLQLNNHLKSVAIIYFIPFPEQPAMIMRMPNGFMHLRLKIETKVFNKMIYKLRKEIPDWGIFEEDAAKLYDLIISPIYKDLKKQHIKTLVIASDGAMRLLPISIFFSPDEKFLIEEFEIVTIPALHLTRLGKTNRKTPNGLFCGITQGHTFGKLRFEALPHISKELETIKKIVPGDVFIDEGFTESNLKSNIADKRYSIVHLATHGEFGSIPEKTFLVAHKSKLTMNSLEKLIKKSQSSSIDLLTLSACQTAIGDERAAFGLAGGAIKAGAKCAIATLWSVDDYASQKIISEFYHNVYKKHYSKAKAMQQAQLTLIERVQFWHPAVWSAFLVIGNWF